MDSITDTFRVYPLPPSTDHHNLIQLNPAGADKRVANHRAFAVASDAYLSDLQEQVDSLTRGEKIRATIREVDSPGPAVFDGQFDHLEDESVYIDYCVLSVLPASLQSMAAQLTETDFPKAAVFDERFQETGPGVLVECYPMFGTHDAVWLDLLIGKRPLEDRLTSIPRVNEPARDVLIQIPESGRAFAVYYFAAASHKEMAEYRKITNTSRGSTHNLEEIYERVVEDDAE
jgi:hypothetical protein